MPRIEFLQSRVNGTVELSIDGGPYCVQLLPSGVHVASDNGNSHVITWDELLAVPLYYGLVVDGCLYPDYFPTREAANDKAADLSGAGIPAAVIKIPRKF